MAHAPAILGSLNDQFKEKFSDKIAKHLTANSIYTQRIPFRESEMIGEAFEEPVCIRRTTGGDYARSGVGQVSYSDIRTSQIVKARQVGSQIFMGDGMDLESVYSSQGTDRAWSPEWNKCMTALMDSSRFRQEMATMWGQHTGGSIGVVDGVPAVSATSTVTILAKEVSSGIIFQLENTLVEIFDSALTTQRISAITGITPAYSVLTVDPDAGTFTLDNSAGVIQSTDVIFFKGERTTSTFNVQAGIHTWLNNTGTIAGISSTANAVWKPNILSAGNLPLTFDKLLTVTGRLFNRGFMGKLIAEVPIRSWNNMMSDMSALVRRTPSEKKYVLGAEAIEFRTGAGNVEVIAHPYAKEGYAHITPTLQSRGDGYTEQELDNAPLRRVGATDLIFVGPSGKGSKGKRAEWFYNLQRTNLLIAETYIHEAVFMTCPCFTASITNIVPA